tara:strand:- start:315 stop:425 length:111 start_codon:yes stop_codon:yes gene_type:complete
VELQGKENVYLALEFECAHIQVGELLKAEEIKVEKE